MNWDAVFTAYGVTAFVIPYTIIGWIMSRGERGAHLLAGVGLCYYIGWIGVVPVLVWMSVDGFWLGLSTAVVIAISAILLTVRLD